MAACPLVDASTVVPPRPARRLLQPCAWHRRHRLPRPGLPLHPVPDHRAEAAGSSAGRGGFLRCGIARRGALRLAGRFGFSWTGGGLVSDGDRRDGFFGRLVGDGGDGLRLRRGPARLFFGQGFGHSWLWICARESKTTRATLKPCPMAIKWSVVLYSAVRSFVRRMGYLSFFSCPASWGRESRSTRILTATIGQPCLNCPISPSSPMRSMPRSPDARSAPPARPNPGRARDPGRARQPHRPATSSRSAGAANSCSSGCLVTRSR